MAGKRLTKSQRLLIIIAISFSFFVAEISVGFYTRALVLVADAFHYLTDLIGYVVAFITFKVSERGDTPKDLPFGWQRATLLGAFFNGVFLLSLGMSILLQSIERFVAIEHVQNPKLVLIVGCVGLTLNILSATILHEHSHDEVPKTTSEAHRSQVRTTSEHRAHRHVRSSVEQQEQRQRKGGHDLGITGVLLHIIGDAANNVGVIIAALIIWKTSYATRFYADPTASTLIALMIIASSLPLMKKSGNILMQTMPDGLDPDDVKHDLETLPGILAVHDLHIWLLNRQKALASAHIMVSEEKIRTIDDFMQLADTVNECFHAYGIHSTTLQPETVSRSPVRGSLFAAISGTEGDLHKRAIFDKTSCRVGCRTANCEEATCCD